jgi:nucleoside-diphosphate-sugar epimerase
MSPTVAVFGASGAVGSAAVEHFVRAGWDTVAVSRRPPDLDIEGYRQVAVDLRDREHSAARLSGLRGVTHVVYAALYEKPGLVSGWVEHDQMATNLAMIQNALRPVIASGGLRHVSLLQGAKAYGSHLHPIPVPARESEPRDPAPNFYWLHEDFTRAAAAESGFAFTLLRPQLVVSPVHGAAMSLVPVIGAYAAVYRELGRPCGFPGGPAFVWEAADAELLAECFEWAALSPAARDETFNVANGDVFAWRQLWPGLVAMLGAEPGPDEPVRLSEFLPRHESTWRSIVDRYGLRPLTLAELLGESHHAADFCFGLDQVDRPPKFLSTIKIRQAGFTPCRDTESSFRAAMATLIRRKVLPGR